MQPRSHDSQTWARCQTSPSLPLALSIIIKAPSSFVVGKLHSLKKSEGEESRRRRRGRRMERVRGRMGEGQKGRGGRRTERLHCSGEEDKTPRKLEGK